MEKFKTVLLILFLAGIVGAFNTIIRLSNEGNQSPLEFVARVLGFIPKDAPEPKRKVDYVYDKLAQSKNGQPSNYTPEAQTQPPSIVSQPQPSPSPTPTPAPQASKPRPTPPPSAIQTAPELPPLPPISTLGASTRVPELPPFVAVPKEAPAKQENSPFPTISSFVDSLLEYIR